MPRLYWLSPLGESKVLPSYGLPSLGLGKLFFLRCNRVG